MKLEGIGGGRLATLHAQRDAELKSWRASESRRQQVAEAVSAWEGTVPETSEEFARLRGQLEDQARQATTAHEDRHGARYALAEQRGTAQKERAALITDREIVARRRSNIDPTLLRARESICSAAGVPDDAVPFAGELIAVRDEYSEWTGPIERVLGGLGRTLLVPDDVYPAVAAAVDATHLGARLVYRRVRVGVTPSAVLKTGALSLVRRVEVADGPLAAWIHHHLADRYDYACVDTAAGFADHARAVTCAGQVKHSAERHEKDDRSRIDDRRRWVLGFDNEAKLEDIRRRIADLDVTIAGATSRLDALDREDQQIAVQNRAAQTVLDAQWADVDVSGAQAAVDAVESRLESWQQDNPEHSAVSVALELAKKAENEADAARRQADTALTVHRTAVTELETRIAQAELDGKDAAPAAVAARIKARFQKFARRVTSDNIDKALFEVGQGIGKDRADAQNAVSAADASIVRILSQYLARWESRGGELRIDAEYVDRRTDDPPAPTLRRSSPVRRSVLPVVARPVPPQYRRTRSHDPQGARRDPFPHRPGEQLTAPLRVRHRPVVAHRCPRATVAGGGRSSCNYLTRITSGGWDIEQRPAAEERFERMAAVLERLASKEPADQRWQRQVLDTRLHVGFIGVEVDGAGEARNYHDSSSGLSGGQAQKLVFLPGSGVAVSARPRRRRPSPLRHRHPG